MNTIIHGMEKAAKGNKGLKKLFQENKTSLLGGLTEEIRARFIDEHLFEGIEKRIEALEKLIQQEQETFNKLIQSHTASQKLESQSIRIQGIQKQLEGVQKLLQWKNSVTNESCSTIKRLIKEGVASRKIQHELSRIQKMSTWIKLPPNVLMWFMIFGISSSFFEARIVKPWQEKTYQERGTTAEALTPSILAMIPGAATLGILMSDKLLGRFITKLGPVLKFVVADVAALGVFVASFFYLFNKKLQEPPAAGKKTTSGPPTEQKQKTLAVGGPSAFTVPTTFRSFQVPKTFQAFQPSA
jgi:hypothetical protein